MIVVRVSREWIEVVGDGIQHRSRALLTFLPQGGRALIAGVGQTEAEVRANIETHKQKGELPSSFRVVLPGEDAWWDAQCAWPPRDDKPTRTVPDQSEALLLNPLASSTWLPSAILSLVRYVLATSSPKGLRWLRWSFLRPKLMLELGSDFSPVERAELLDVFEEAWGRSRVQGLADVPRLTRPPWWLLRWFGLFWLFAALTYSAGNHLPLWQRVIAIVLAMAPMAIAKHKEDRASRSAPRRPASTAELR